MEMGFHGYINRSSLIYNSSSIWTNLYCVWRTCGSNRGNGLLSLQL